MIFITTFGKKYYNKLFIFRELLCLVDELGNMCVSQPLLIIMSLEIPPYKLKNVHG